MEVSSSKPGPEQAQSKLRTGSEELLGLRKSSTINQLKAEPKHNNIGGKNFDFTTTTTTTTTVDQRNANTSCRSQQWSENTVPRTNPTETLSSLDNHKHNPSGRATDREETYEYYFKERPGFKSIVRRRTSSLGSQQRAENTVPTATPTRDPPDRPTSTGRILNYYTTERDRGFNSTRHRRDSSNGSKQRTENIIARATPTRGHRDSHHYRKRSLTRDQDKRKFRPARKLSKEKRERSRYRRKSSGEDGKPRRYRRALSEEKRGRRRYRSEPPEEQGGRRRYRSELSEEHSERRSYRRAPSEAKRGRRRYRSESSEEERERRHISESSEESMPYQGHNHRGGRSGDGGNRDRERGVVAIGNTRGGTGTAASSSNTSPALASPTLSSPASSVAYGIGGPNDGMHHPTHIQRSRPYFTEQQIEEARPKDPGLQSKDITMRLSVCTWIMQVGDILRFPVRTMTTAMVLFHRFRLFHPKTDFPFADCAAAALFVACKIEDTLKKSKEILAAGHNLKHGTLHNEPIDPDSALLDEPSRRVLSLERMILESSSFDFRNRQSQLFVIKFCKHIGFPRHLGQLAWNISIDAYRTLAPLKATPHVQALAAIYLASRLLDTEEYTKVDYAKFEAKKEQVIGVLNDLLDLYTHHRIHTKIGEKHSYTPETFISIRIAVNNEASSSIASSTTPSAKTGSSIPSNAPTGPSRPNGIHHRNDKDHRDHHRQQPNGKKSNNDTNVATPANGQTPTIGGFTPGYSSHSEKDKQAIGESVRFMLDGERERAEKAAVGRIDAAGQGSSGGR